MLCTPASCCSTSLPGRALSHISSTSVVMQIPGSCISSADVRAERSACFCREAVAASWVHAACVLVLEWCTEVHRVEILPGSS